ncbi:hypothetical protein BH23ACT9_BH23ACT9_12710 [soil metagenome]
MSDGYARLGLRGNPFVAEQEPGVAEAVFLDVGLPPLPARGPSRATVIEVVGCKGAGKTTHLLRWCDQAGGRYRHVGPGLGRLAWPPVAPVVAWDEVDRLPRPILRVRLAAARRAGALVLLGTHVPTGLADVSHRLPSPDGRLVTAFARRRVEAATLPGAHVDFALAPAEAEAIAAASGGCWWTIGTALHIRAAQAAAL